MRWLLTAILFLGTAMALPADTFVYVSMAPEQKIQVFRLETKDGTLTPVDSLDVAGAPGALGVDLNRKFLYASLRTNSTLASFKINTSNGKLTPLNTAALGKGENATYVAVDITGRWLMSASYTGGKVVVHKLNVDGTIVTPAVQTVETAKTAHAVVMVSAGHFVFVPHVAPNAIYQFKLDLATGKLTEAGKVSGGTKNAGPRHLAFDPVPNLDHVRGLAFTSDEEGNSITAYGFGKEKGLAPLQTLSTLPANYKEKNTTADVKVHPNGKFVWVSNRGHDSLAGFAIDRNDKLTALGQTPTEKTPRSFDIEPDGKYLIAAGEGSGKLAVYQIDAKTGTLTRLHTYEVGKSLTWVTAVKFSEK